MADRRSMNQALHMTPEKVAFINEAPMPKTESAAPTNTDRPTKDARTTRNSAQDCANTTARRVQASSPTNSVYHSAPYVEALVPLTTRLAPATASALKRAYLERKLAGAAHATQQEIVEEALQFWLEREGYLVAAF